MANSYKFSPLGSTGAPFCSQSDLRSALLLHGHHYCPQPDLWCHHWYLCWPEEWEAEERGNSEDKERKRRHNSQLLVLKGKTSKTITCQPTPKGELARRLSKAINERDNKEVILVAEDGRRPALASFREADAFFSGGCRFNDVKCQVEKGERLCCLRCLVWKLHYKTLVLLRSKKIMVGS